MVFAAFDHPDYRRYMLGQTVSLVGTWMQTVAQGWLVLQLTGSGTLVGVLIAAQTLPVLLVGPYAGVLADRLDRRRLLVQLQVASGVLATALGLLTVTGAVRLWQVYVLAAATGVVVALENPSRQAFITDLVGPEQLRRAVGLNSVLVNLARVVGPAVAGLIIALGGIGICFLLNALSYLVVIHSLRALDLDALRPATPVPNERGRFRAGLGYVRSRPDLFIPLGMMAVIGCLAYEFQVVLPVLATEVGGDARTYGVMTSAMGVGAIAGGLYSATVERPGTPAVIRAAAGFGVAICAAGLAPDLATTVAALAVVGGFSVAFMSRGNSTLQLAADPRMRGRVIALWTVALLGTTPLGAPLLGAVSEHLGARTALLVGGGACLVAATGGMLSYRRRGEPEALGELS